MTNELAESLATNEGEFISPEGKTLPPETFAELPEDCTTSAAVELLAVAFETAGTATLRGDAPRCPTFGAIETKRTRNIKRRRKNKNSRDAL